MMRPSSSYTTTIQYDWHDKSTGPHAAEYINNLPRVWAFSPFLAMTSTPDTEDKLH